MLRVAKRALIPAVRRRLSTLPSGLMAAGRASAAASRPHWRIIGGSFWSVVQNSRGIHAVAGSGTGDCSLLETENSRKRPLGPRQRKNADTSSARNIVTAKSAADSSDPHDRLLVVGSGVAGCAAALIAAERHGLPVTLLFAGSVPTDCNSFWAQGGIIYRNYDPSTGDSARSLRDDVHRAGAGLCQDDAVWKLALEGPDRVRELLLNDDPDGAFANVPFDRRNDGALSCCLEASHTAPRIIHRADHTGRAITEHITAAAARHPLITGVPDAVVTELAVARNHSAGQDVCVGAHVLHRRTRERFSLYASRGTILASGGLAGIYEHSTNPTGFNALGSSAALAIRAGAATRDLEYVQFHPTSLYVPGEARFLLTEALRGEGALLRDADGRAFARDYHSDGELAPRDVVARAVFAESQKAREDSVHNAYLDITHRDASWLRERFPSIDAHLRQRGLDLTARPVPVIPAAHYTCGGVATDLHGRASLVGLYAAGEAARTGVHGGNRLASTSLLEGLVYGAATADFVGKEDMGAEATERAREILLSEGRRQDLEDRMEWYSREVVNGEALRTVGAATELLGELKRVMWDDVGLIRTPAGLSRAIDRLEELGREAEELYIRVPAAETAGLRDAARAGESVAKAARANRVSAGTHTIVSDEDDEEERKQQRQGEEEEDDEEQSLRAGFGV